MKLLVSGLLLALACGYSLAKEVLVDVRTAQEYAAGHIEGAIHIEHPDIAQLLSKPGISKDDKVILYCQTGRRSGIALNTLQSLGFHRVENAGGIEQARKTLGKN